MKTLIYVTLACILMAGISATAQAADYEVTLELDDSSKGDLTSVEEWASGAADGTEVPRSFRRMANAATGEARISLRSRLDGDQLTLDDGSVVTLFEEDTVTVNGPNACRPRVSFSFGGRGRPCAIFLCDGSCINLAVQPPVKGNCGFFCSIFVE